MMSTESTVRLANDLLKHHGLLEWKVVLDRAKTRAGQCCYRTKTIHISRNRIAHSSEEDVKDTILHEIAHALTPGHKHDAHWKAKAIEIGCNGQVHCQPFTQHRYHITCPCLKVDVRRYKMVAWMREQRRCPDCLDTVIITQSN